MSTAVRSHAKINLGLYLGAPRPDGFHALVTVYQTLEMHDVVTVAAKPAERDGFCRLTSNDHRVPTDNRNTAWRMVELALKTLNLNAEVDIHIEKRLPVQGGLGAGSGNAVAALVGLDAELGTPFRNLFTPRLELPGQIGFRCAVLLDWRNGTRSGSRAGSLRLSPDIDPVWCVVAVPEIGVSTPQAFRDWDALCAAEGLTAEISADRLKESSRAYASAFRGEIPEGGHRTGSSGVFPDGEDLAGRNESALVRTGITSWIENDFERVVFPQHPSLAEIKRVLAATATPEAALLASLSGSGSALFGLYLTRGDAEVAKDRIESQVPGVTAHVTQTLPRQAYWDQMLLKSAD